MLQDILWVEKYRPKKIDDVILPKELKKTFVKFVEQKEIPNLILSGGSGVGKTTIARAMLEELNANYIVINGSLHGNIDTLRNDIQNFASTMSFTGDRKYVILDEGDYLNAQSTQPALRNFMEEFSSNCGFIITCNFLNRIIKPLHSRCSVINFTIQSKQKAKLAFSFLNRLKNILSLENISYDEKVLAQLIMKYFPDWRRVLNECQRHSYSGSINDEILSNVKDVSLDSLVKAMKEKNFSSMRKWVSENLDNDVNEIFKNLYERFIKNIKPNSVPQFILHLAKYQYQSAFVADQEVNIVALLTEVMADCEVINE
tara:strand:- start:1490 stop:2434 length:945 start_codon:yes stop_codon:yes gene_type:complete